MAELIVVRHGESVGNVAADAAERARAEIIDLDQRDADVELSERGREQAAALGGWLADLSPHRRPALVLCSPYVRAQQTASIALATSGHPAPVRLDERLRDRELGILDKLTSQGIRARYPDESQRRAYLGKFYYRPPGGESWADLALRLRPVLAELDTADGGPDESMLVVCHDAIIFLVRYLIEHLTEREVLDLSAAHPVRNCAVTTFRRPRPGTPWQLTDFNLDAHLAAAGVAATAHPGERDDHHPR